MPSMRMNTQPPAARADDGGWQTVGEPKVKAAKHEAAAPKKAPAANGTASAPRQTPKQPNLYQGTSSVLAELDKQWAKQQRKIAQVQDHVDANAFDALEQVEAREKARQPPPQTLSPADSAADSPTHRVVRAAKPAKAKKDKPEKAAPPAAAKPRADASVKSLAAEVDVDGFREFMVSLEAKHAADEVLQLQCVCDFLRSVFATARMQFSTMLQTMPMAAVADEPWAALPGPLRQALARFVGSKQPAALADYLCQACESIVTGLPERGAGGPPAKVEVLVMIAAILRMRPAAALLPACDTLSKMGVRLLAPGRLPTTMWVLEQAAHASGGQGVGSAVHAWCRVILPALVLAEVPSSSGAKKVKSEKVGGYQMEAGSREAAVDYLLTLLARPGLAEAAGEGLDTRQPGKPLEAVVPCSAVAEVSAALRGDGRRPGMSRETPALLQRIEPQLRGLAVATPAEHHLAALLAKCLEGAESCSDDALAEHASLLVALLAAHPAEIAAMWSTKHKTFIGGSTRILQHLAASRSALSDLLAAKDGHATLIAALDQIAAKQSTLVKSAKASPARKAAHDAQAAIDALVAANSVQAGGSSALLSLLLLVAGAVAVPVLIERNPDAARQHLSGLLGAETAEGVVKYCTQLVFCCVNEVPKALSGLAAQAREFLDGLKTAKN